MRLKAFFILPIMILTGCGIIPSVGPDYVPPTMPVPENWQNHASPDHELTGPEQANTWWNILGDERLNKLVTKAVDTNRQLDIAIARVRETKESRRASVGDFFPQIGGGIGITRNKNSQNTIQGRVFGGSFNLAQTTYDIGVDASWEIDVFGGLRRQYEAADATVGAAEEQLHDVLVSLISEVVRNYYEVRALEKRLSIARENIQIQQESLDIVQSRVNAGLASELDLAQAKVQLENTRSTLPTLEANNVNSRTRLAVLLGCTVQSLDSFFPREPVGTGTLIVQNLPEGILQGVPSDILRNRPDIRTAERNLAIETALVGVATAELFPKFTLTSGLHLQSISSTNFLDWASNAWNIAPSATMPIFTAGKLTAQLRAQSERANQVASQYEQTVLQALAEGESSIASFEQEKMRFDTLRRSYEASLQALSLSKELYSKGLADFLRVIEAQRSAFASEEALAISEQLVISNLVASYKALGYGWVGQQSVEDKAARS